MKTKNILCATSATLVITGIFCCLHLPACKKAEEKTLSENIVQIGEGKNARIVNIETGKTLIKDIEVEWIATGNDSLAVFSQDDKRGYFNINTGTIVIPPTYRRAWLFSDGLAGVEQDGKIGFINPQGEVVIDFRFPYKGHCLSKFLFRNGHCAVADEQCKIGVIDTTGNWVIQPQYDDIEVFPDFAIASNKTGFKQQLDFEGHILLNCMIDNVYRIQYTTHYTDKETGAVERIELTSDEYFKYEVGDWYGLMNAQGEFITAPVYKDILGLTATVFRAVVDDYVSEVIINNKGEILSTTTKK